MSWGQRMAELSGAFLFLSAHMTLVSSTHTGQLTGICNYSSRRCNTISWIPQGPAFTSLRCNRNTHRYNFFFFLRSCFWNCSQSVIAMRVSLAFHQPQEQLNQLRHNTSLYCFLPSSEYEVISRENGSFSGKNKSIQITNQTFSTVENLKPDTR